LEEKILIRGSPNISSKFSRRKTMELILKKMEEHSKNSSRRLKKPREISQVFIKLKLLLKASSTASISVKPSLVLDSKSFALIYSRKRLSQLSKCLMMQA